MRAHAKPSGIRCPLFAGVALAAAMLTMAAMPCSASAQYFSFDYSYGYPETAYSYAPYWYPGYSYPYYYYPFYAHRHHWQGDWDHDRWDRHWAGHGWDHGGWHNSGRGKEVHGGGGRAFPDSGSIARGNQFHH